MTVPCFTTQRHGLTAMRYESSAGCPMSQIAKSAALPASSVPCVAPMPSAAAPTRVKPASASSGVILNMWQAMFIICGGEQVGEDDGLLLVATAILTPCLRK